MSDYSIASGVEADDGVAPQGEGAASWVTAKWRDADTVLMEERRDYWLNTSFFEGDQWVFWSPSNEVAEFPRQPGRVRATFNKLYTNVTINNARLLKRKLVFEVPAGASDDATVSAAKLGEHLLEAERAEQHWEDIRYATLLNETLGGVAGVMVEWNPNIGDPVGIDPENGEPILSGNPQLTPLSIPEFTLEPGTFTPRDSRWVITCKAFTPEQVMIAYGLATPPSADANQGVGPLQRRLTSKRTGLSKARLTLVYTYYERPSDRGAGRHIVVVNGKTVVDEEWPFPFDTLPLYVFRQTAMPKKWTSTTYMTQARSLQIQLNAAQSLIMEHMKLAGNARLAVAEGSNVNSEDLNDIPGSIVYYDGQGGPPPQYISPAMVPAWMFDHVAKVESQIDDICFVHGISRGQAPGDRNSGLALTVLAEKDETPLGLMAKDQAEGWGHIAGLVLEMWAANVVEQRKSVVQTFKGAPPVSRYWNGAQLRGQTRARVPLEAVMPYSRAAQQAWVTQLAQTFPNIPSFQDPAVLTRMLDLPDSDGLIAAINADAAKAHFENHMISTGEPFLPETFDVHAIHIAEHNRFRKSTAYIYMDPENKQMLDHHVMAHMQLAAEEAKNQAELEATAPGASAIPQDNEPDGSAVPPDQAEQSPANGGMAPPNPMAGGKGIPQAQPQENTPPVASAGAPM